MSPLDEAPEQRWRRTVDRRSRPAKLKVDRLLRDFGYSDLDAQVGDAIEARLAGVALAVSPPLRDAAVGQVVTIYADERPIEERTPPPAPDARDREPEPQPEPEAAPKPRPRPRPNVAPPPPEPAVVTDIAQMVTYLKQEVLDARAESERLRTELDQRIAARTDAATEAQAIIAEQAATLEDQSRQIAELGAALDHTRQALAETREEIRRAVGELQALPAPELFPEAVTPDDEADPADDVEPAAAAPYADPEVDVVDVAWPVEDPGHVVQPPPAGAADAPAIADAGFDVEEPALGLEAAATELEDPALPAAETPSEHEEPASGFDDPLLDLDEPPLRADAGADERELPDDTAAAGEPVAEDAPGFADEAGLADEPAFAAEPPFADEPAFAAEASEQRDEPESWVPAQLRERDPEPEPDPDAGADFAGADAPLPESPEPAAEAREQTAEARERAADLDANGGEPPIGDDALADFDEFLYDPDELYDPESRAAGDDPSARTEHDAWLDEPAGALPPPPPPPPSPWAEEPETELEAPPARDRTARGKALRGRGGRGRGRWQGSCSICGRLPVENKRKDLEAAGWDLDDDAAACPQCRGIG